MQGDAPRQHSRPMASRRQLPKGGVKSPLASTRLHAKSTYGRARPVGCARPLPSPTQPAIHRTRGPPPRAPTCALPSRRFPAYNDSWRGPTSHARPERRDRARGTETALARLRARYARSLRARRSARRGEQLRLTAEPTLAKFALPIRVGQKIHVALEADADGECHRQLCVRARAHQHFLSALLQHGRNGQRSGSPIARAMHLRGHSGQRELCNTERRLAHGPLAVPQQSSDSHCR